MIKEWNIQWRYAWIICSSKILCNIKKKTYITYQKEPDQTCWNCLNMILRISCLDNIEQYKNWSALKSPESVENIPQNFEQINKNSLIE